MAPRTDYCLPIRDLENDRVKLVVFDPDIHAELFVSGTILHPFLFDLLLSDPFTSVESFINGFYIPRVQSTDTCALYAIYDKTVPSANGDGSGQFAGIIGLFDMSPEHLHAEVSSLIILPQFHRTHVNSNAIGLLMFYALELPNASSVGSDEKTYEGAIPLTGGLGLRRLQYQANALNEISAKAARRMGFTFEGINRWNRILKRTKVPPILSLRSRNGDPRAENLGVHTIRLGTCWDDWEGVTRSVEGGEKREPVRDIAARAMARRS